MQKSIKILLIDDDPIANFIHMTVLKKLRPNDEVIVKKNGGDALKFLTECYSKDNECPQMILLDINMPVIDGYDFLQEFKNISFSNNNEIQIIALTTSTVSRDIEKMKSFGISDYVIKPLTQEKLMPLMEKHPLLSKDHSISNSIDCSQ